jgi:hypothetical protein
VEVVYLALLVGAFLAIAAAAIVVLTRLFAQK